jgi:hypothetical protein
MKNAGLLHAVLLATMTATLGGCAAEPDDATDDSREASDKSESAISGGSADGVGHPSVGQLVVTETWSARCAPPSSASMCKYSETFSANAVLVGAKTAVSSTNASARHHAEKDWTIKRTLKFSRDETVDVVYANAFAPSVLLFRLAESPGIVPAVVADFPPVVGEDITLVGWGTVNGTARDGVRRKASNQIDVILDGGARAGLNPWDKLFAYSGTKQGVEGMTCSGDVGGGVFVNAKGAEVLLGVVRTVPACPSATAAGTATALYFSKNLINECKSAGDRITYLGADGVKRVDRTPGGGC